MLDLALKAETHRPERADTHSNSGKERDMSRLGRAASTAMISTAAGLALTALAPAGPAEATELDAWACPAGRICLYDGANGVNRIYSATDGCWFDNIGLQGIGDRTSSVYNRTRHRVNLANWNGKAWEHLVHANPGQRFNLPASANNRTDAVHVIC